MGHNSSCVSSLAENSKSGASTGPAWGLRPSQEEAQLEQSHIHFLCASLSETLFQDNECEKGCIQLLDERGCMSWISARDLRARFSNPNSESPCKMEWDFELPYDGCHWFNMMRNLHSRPDHAKLRETIREDCSDVTEAATFMNCDWRQYSSRAMLCLFRPCAKKHFASLVFEISPIDHGGDAKVSRRHYSWYQRIVMIRETEVVSAAPGKELIGVGLYPAHLTAYLSMKNISRLLQPTKALHRQRQPFSQSPPLPQLF